MIANLINSTKKPVENCATDKHTAFKILKRLHSCEELNEN